MQVFNPVSLAIPTGSLVLWTNAAAPDGFLICDGSAVSRTTYAALFAVTSTTYGAGDGSTTFNLPDLRQRFPLGKAAAGTGSTLGGTGGTIDHTHTIAHTHQIDPPATATNTSGSTVAATPLLGSASAATHTHTVDIAAFASGAESAANSGTANAPFQTFNYIIKV